MDFPKQLKDEVYKYATTIPRDNNQNIITMDGKKVYQIEINGIKDSISAVDALNILIWQKTKDDNCGIGRQK